MHSHYAPQNIGVYSNSASQPRALRSDRIDAGKIDIPMYHAQFLCDSKHERLRSLHHHKIACVDNVFVLVNLASQSAPEQQDRKHQNVIPTFLIPNASL